MAFFFPRIVFLKVTMLNFIFYGNDNISTKHHISFLLHLVVWNFGAIDIVRKIMGQEVNVVFLLDGTF
jgi:hypothetical protein